MMEWTRIETPLVWKLPNSTNRPFPGIWINKPGVNSMNSTTATKTGPQSDIFNSCSISNSLKFQMCGLTELWSDLPMSTIMANEWGKDWLVWTKMKGIIKLSPNWLWGGRDKGLMTRKRWRLQNQAILIHKEASHYIHGLAWPFTLIGYWKEAAFVNCDSWYENCFHLFTNRPRHSSLLFHQIISLFLPISCFFSHI